MDTFRPGDSAGLLRAIERARRPLPDVPGPARLATRHTWEEIFAGRGLAARGFGFATLLIDLLAECGIGGSEPSGRARIMQT